MKKHLLIILGLSLALFSCTRHSHVVKSLPPPSDPVVITTEPVPVDSIRVFDVEPDSVHIPDREQELTFIDHSMLRAAGEDTTLILIPMVVHVMKNGDPAMEISIAQIQSEVDVMNQQLRGRGPYGQGSTDTHMEVRLAVRDPNGNPTPGVNYVDASAVPGYKENGIRKSGSTIGAIETDVKKLSYWDRNKYLNVWIVSEVSGNNAQGGTLANAYLPNTAGTNQDGIMCQYTAWGIMDLDKDGFYDLDKLGFKCTWSFRFTGIHEFGHWANLYHTFQGTTDCVKASTANCTTQGDYCCDTPVTIQKTNCINDPKCILINTPDGNWEGYTNRYCMNVESPGFTYDQMKRMRYGVTELRKSITLSDGLTPPVLLDAAVYMELNATTCKDQADAMAKVLNTGTNTITSVMINGVTYPVSIEKSKSQTIKVGVITMPTNKSYSFTAKLTKVNGIEDTYNGNNSSTASITRISGTDVTVSFKPDFYGSEASWSIVDSVGTVERIRMKNPVGFVNGLNQAPKIVTDCLNPGDYWFVIKDSHGDLIFPSTTVASVLNGNAKIMIGNLPVLDLTKCPCTVGCTSRGCLEYRYKFSILPSI